MTACAQEAVCPTFGRYENKECTSKGCDYFEGGLFSEFQISASIAIIQSAENETDFNNTLDYVQEFLPLQSSVNQSLGKALDSLLGSAMTMSANMLLNRRDNYLKSCTKDVTEDDISRLRNAPFTSNEVFPEDTISEIQRNFIQWSHVKRDSRNRESRKEYNQDMKTKGTIGLRIGLFTPIMKLHPQVRPKAVHPPQLVTGGEAPTLPGPLEAGVAGGSDWQEVGVAGGSGRSGRRK